MTSPRCAHLEAADSRIAMHGSRLLVCPICWLVVDPFSRHATSLTSRLPALATPSAEPTASSDSDESDEFSVPFPRRRLLTSPYLTGLVFLIWLMVISGLYGTWFYQMYHPTFQEYTDPTQQYAALYPGLPVWSGGSAGGGSDGQFEREIPGISETYRIKVTNVHDWRFARTGNMNSESLANFLSESGFGIVQARPDVFLASASADYELWISGKDVVVGRIMTVNETVYQMTIRGAHLSLRDSRVQRFFNSFHFVAP